MKVCEILVEQWFLKLGMLDKVGGKSLLQKY